MLYDNAKLTAHEEALELARRQDALTPPLHVRLEPTESCNFQCRFCWTQNADRMAVLTEATGFQRNSARMGLERMIRLVEELHAVGTRAVSLVAIGDPLTFPHIEQVMARASELEIHLGVTSNLAMKIGDDLIDQLARARWVRWSMNGGSRDGYIAVNQPRGTDPSVAYDRVQDNVRRILQRRQALGSSLLLNASVVISRWNGGQELYHAASFAHSLGIDSVSFRPDMDPRRGDEPAAIPPDAWEALKAAQRDFGGGHLKIHVEDQREQDVLKIDDPDLRCFYSNYSLYISAAGDVYPCCYTRGNPAYVIGNIGGKNFGEFWTDYARQNHWKTLAIHECPSCPYVELNRNLARLASGELAVSELHRPQPTHDWFV